jgi:pimeloyl-ACP methyl ester carboxylesterase
MLRRTFLSLTAALAPLMARPARAQQSDQPNQGAAMLPAPSKSGYAPVNGVEVYYAVYGEGAPLVLLHGGLATIDMFGPNVALLAEGHQVIAIDLQGHGHTLPFERPMSYEAMADDVAGVIQYLGLEKADIMGYSLGAGTALRVAIQHPDRVNKLIVASAPYAWAGWHDYNQQGMRSMTADMAEGMKGTPLYESYAAVAPDVNNFPVLIEQVTAMMMHDYDWSAEVKQIKAPTLLMFADWDAVRTSHIASFFELLGGGLQDALWDGSGMNANRLAIIPNATHYTIFADTRPGETAIAFIDAPAR